MRTFTTIAMLVAASLTVAARQDTPTFKATTQIVSVPATVLDGQGRLVPNLEQDEFTILDNGKPQPITFFQNETQPFTVVVMLDYSASMTSSLDLLRAAA
jgi:VWFA-related protein